MLLWGYESPPKFESRSTYYLTIGCWDGGIFQTGYVSTSIFLGGGSKKKHTHIYIYLYTLYIYSMLFGVKSEFTSTTMQVFLKHNQNNGHYITNPNNTLLKGNPLNWTYLCSVWSPKCVMHIMIPAKFHLKSHKLTMTLKLKACHFSRKKASGCTHGFCTILFPFACKYNENKGRIYMTYLNTESTHMVGL